MAWSWIWFSTALIGLWLLGNLFTWGLQHWFIFWPHRLDSAHVLKFPVPFREHFLETPNGGRINLVWFQRTTSRGVVVFFHGNSGNLTRWGHLYHLFFQRNYDYIVFDYRGFGKSRGRRSQQNLYADAEAVYRFARRHYPPESIVLYGRSLGSAFATFVGARHPAQRVFLETPFYSMKHLFYTYYPFLPPVMAFRYSFPSYRDLARITCPVDIVHGTRDLIVPLRCARRLKTHLKPGDTFVVIGEGRHNNLQFFPGFQQAIDRALAES